MLLIYTQKLTPRISYIFKHICLRVLSIEIEFTSVIEEFIAHAGPKISYGKKPLGNELFFQSYGLLEQQGFESVEIAVKKWGNTFGFFSVSNLSTLPFDIFSSSFYMISRYEEYLPHVKDEMGRFMASESLAFKEGFIHQPIVDIWVYLFKDKLSQTFPEIEFPQKKITIHPVIEAAQPYAYKQKGLFRSSVGYVDSVFHGKFRNIISRIQVNLGLKRDPLDTFKWLVNIANRSNFKLTVFFLLGNALSFTESMNTHRQKFKMLIKFVSDYKDVGLIFSYNSLNDYEMLKSEKRRMQEITNRSLASSMNSEFLVNLPDIYRHLVELEVKRDFTMVFRNTVGFRAGTCTPFLFYDLDYEIKTPLLIHPSAMTTLAFQKKYASDIEKTVNNIIKAIAEVNGTFTMIFSNKDFSSEESNKVWRTIFSEKLQEYAE
ncbi:hypothetical protein Aeqsu_1891 [Aequorivita sublithincola DSM 14238]|uniref:DUF7033 domain-containing protein n=1 Tax=Aequorivita sublithincola (strain DSM 14238 / LMG 21431 / ACAM 643 / 9-3) TaxID=746697 RepID=I3YWJ8_AEQSU|nr:hypothetical protein [Aequorivita sublithincola]AFL81366.1 hypothetical protein Aeqsu_1891 [Aequorivita sublithincola DSM 14238]